LPEESKQSIKLTTVTPVYAGKEYLSELVARLDELRKEWAASGAPFELAESIFVNDSSADGSLDLLVDLANQYPWLRVVNLSKNFGQHPATIAGVLHASGDWIVTLDEDLQHDPAHIESMLKTATRHGADIIYAKPEGSVHQKSFRDWTSRNFKRFIAYVTGNPHVTSFNSFRLMRGMIARAAASVCSHETYFDNALCWFTTRVDTIPVPMKDMRFIESGKSGYTLRKLLSHSRRMIISSDTKILRIGAIFGFVVMLLSIIVGGNIIIQKLVNPESIVVTGWTSLAVTLLFFGGFLSFLVGIALEYITAIMLHFQGKPTFFVVDRSSDNILMKYFSSMQSNDCTETKRND
jgi:glycosyltransferase involved in cell wall biosynthesis